MQRSRFPILASCAALTAFLVSAGCADPLQYENFSHIRQNATQQWEVEKLIGEPDQKLDNQWLYERPDRHLTALVDFNAGGTVTRKQWIDAESGVWEDSKEPGEGNSHQRIDISSSED